ncbi:hypothetical protein J6590_077845 [Homalodisca vitripennis]|nr:hypothetical protein J6590_077845 [Homalodisca vitripennis]
MSACLSPQDQNILSSLKVRNRPDRVLVALYFTRRLLVPPTFTAFIDHVTLICNIDVVILRALDQKDYARYLGVQREVKGGLKE